jgi:PAS domain S-box-containing protein
MVGTMSGMAIERGGGALDDGLRRLLDRAVAASSNGIVITDNSLNDFPIIYVNPAFERTTGYTADEATGRNCRFLQADDREQEARDELRLALEEGREARVVLRNYRKDGELFWNELYVSPVYGEDGTVTHFVGVQNDITDRRRIEEALREREDRLRIATESTGLGTWDYYPETGELRWDDRCKAMFGISPDAEVDYETFLAALHPDNREWTEEVVRQALDPAGSGIYSIEFRTVGIEDGVERWIASQGQAFFEGETPVRFVGTVVDITERKRAEEERDLLLVREQLARAEAVATRRRLEVLAASGPVLASSLDYSTTLARIPRLVVPDFAELCVLDIVREGVVEQVGAAHADPEKEPLLRDLKLYRRFDEGSPGYAARVLNSGRPLLLPEVGDAFLGDVAANDEHRRLIEILGLRSIISVPLMTRRRVLGVMTLADSSKTFNEEDLSLAEGLASRCALAMDNASIYEEQTYISRTIQRSLLPDLPAVPGVEVSVEYLPVEAESEIGGDFYDLMDGPEGSGSWLAILGDVRGKGAVAASITALARYSIRAIALKEDDPATLLTSVNAVMLRQLADYQYCTVACVRLNPLGAGRGVDITVTRGGHPPPLIRRASGAVENVGPMGRALGIFPDAELSEETTHLDTGDVLLLYTDGVTEARSAAGLFYGEDRLRHLLASCGGQSADEITACIKSSILDFQEGPPRDDLALMVLRVVR